MAAKGPKKTNVVYWRKGKGGISRRGGGGAEKREEVQRDAERHLLRSVKTQNMFKFETIGARPMGCGGVAGKRISRGHNKGGRKRKSPNRRSDRLPLGRDTEGGLCTGVRGAQSGAGGAKGQKKRAGNMRTTGIKFEERQSRRPRRE